MSQLASRGEAPCQIGGSPAPSVGLASLLLGLLLSTVLLADCAILKFDGFCANIIYELLSLLLILVGLQMFSMNKCNEGTKILKPLEKIKVAPLAK